MPNLDQIQFTSEAQIKAILPVGDLVDIKQIHPAIRETADRIRSILGTTLANRMRRLIRDAKTISAASQAAPCVITTVVNHGLASTTEIGVIEAKGMPDLNGMYTASPTGANTLSLSYLDGSTTLIPLDATAYPAYSPGSGKLVVCSNIEFGLLRLLQIYHAKASVHEMLLHHSARIANAGVVQMGEFSQGGQNTIKQVDLKALSAVIDFWASKVITCETDMRMYICEHDEHFTDYTTSDNPVERRGGKKPRISFM